MPHRGCVVALPVPTRTPGFYSPAKKRGIIDRRASTDESYLRGLTIVVRLPYVRRISSFGEERELIAYCLWRMVENEDNRRRSAFIL